MTSRGDQEGTSYRPRVQVELDEAGLVPGGRAEGTLRVTVDTTLASATLAAQWVRRVERHDGSTYLFAGDEVRSDVGTIPAGQQTSIPFVVPLDGCTEDYVGELLRIGWALRFRFVSPTDEFTFTEPVRVVPEPVRPLELRFFGQSAPRDRGVGLGLAIGAGLTAAGLGLAAWLVTLVLGDQGSSWLLLGLAALALLLGISGVIALSGVLREARTPGRRGPWPELGGDAGPYYVVMERPAWFAPPQLVGSYDLRRRKEERGYRADGVDGLDLVVGVAEGCPVERLDARLVVEEVVRVDERNAASTAIRTREVRAWGAPMSAAGRGVFEGRLPLEEAPYTSGARDHTGIRWQLRLHAKLQGDAKPWVGVVGLEATPLTREGGAVDGEAGSGTAMDRRSAPPRPPTF